MFETEFVGPCLVRKLKCVSVSTSEIGENVVWRYMYSIYVME